MDVFIHFHESMFFFVFICSGLNCDFYCVVLIMFFLFFCYFLLLRINLISVIYGFIAAKTSI